MDPMFPNSLLTDAISLPGCTGRFLCARRNTGQYDLRLLAAFDVNKHLWITRSPMVLPWQSSAMLDIAAFEANVKPVDLIFAKTREKAWGYYRQLCAALSIPLLANEWSEGGNVFLSCLRPKHSC